MGGELNRRVLLAVCLATLVSSSLASVARADGPAPSRADEAGGEESGASANATESAAGSALRFLSLPFSDDAVPVSEGWIYQSYRDGEFHGGVDWSLEPGTPILAAADGVAMACRQWQYGNFVCVKHDNGYFTFYAHLDRVVPGMKTYPESQRANTDYSDWTPVRAGDVVGYCGKDGALGGYSPHLHFEVRTSSWGRQPDIVVDPYGVFAKAKFYPSGTEAEIEDGYMWLTYPPSPADTNRPGNERVVDRPDTPQRDDDRDAPGKADGYRPMNSVAHIDLADVVNGILSPEAALQPRRTDTACYGQIPCPYWAFADSRLGT